MGVEFQGMKRPPPNTVRITNAAWLVTMFVVASVVSLDRKLHKLSAVKAVYNCRDKECAFHKDTALCRYASTRLT